MSKDNNKLMTVEEASLLQPEESRAELCSKIAELQQENATLKAKLSGLPQDDSDKGCEGCEYLPNKYQDQPCVNCSRNNITRYKDNFRAIVEPITVEPKG
jgi:hypothetical protein